VSNFVVTHTHKTQNKQEHRHISLHFAPAAYFSDCFGFSFVNHFIYYFLTSRSASSGSLM